MTYAQSACIAIPYIFNSFSAFKSKPTPLFFTCLTSWLTEIPIANITSTPLLHLAFESLFSDELFDSVVDFIVAMFRETREVYENTDSIKALYEELTLVSPKLGALGNEPDTYRGIIRIYSEAGEAWVALIAHEPEKYYFLVQCIAQCTEYSEDLEVTKITFNFWCQLTQLITVEKHKHAKELFRPIYAGLVDTMIGHLHYPEGNDRSDIFKGDRVAEDKFRDFRHEMGDVLKGCCRVVGGSACLGKAYFAVRQKLDDQARGVNVRWQDVEAPLFSMRMMAREVDTEEEEVVPAVMKLLVSLPEHDKIRFAATLVLGRYTEWTAKHPEYLEFQLNYISSGFDNQSKDVISAAAQALKHFCQDCKKVALTHNVVTDISFWSIM
jgi:transportin-3